MKGRRNKMHLTGVSLLWPTLNRLAIQACSGWFHLANAFMLSTKRLAPVFPPCSFYFSLLRRARDNLLFKDNFFCPSRRFWHPEPSICMAGRRKHPITVADGKEKSASLHPRFFMYYDLTTTLGLLAYAYLLNAFFLSLSRNHSLSIYHIWLVSSRCGRLLV